MKLVSFRVRNYRTLESLDLSFPTTYAAICGPNDSGKTNVVRALRALVSGENPSPFALYQENGALSMKDDYPKWRDTEPSKREISLDICISLDKVRDAAFYQFVLTQLTISQAADVFPLTISASYTADKPDPQVTVRAQGTSYTDLNAQEVLKKLQSSRTILFHNSTQIDSRFMYPGGSIAGHIREISGQHEALVSSMKKVVNRGLAKISKSQQAEFEGLLGRLETKYKVGLSMPAFDFGYLPFSITLGDKKFEVPLDDWGSGTRNRTLVLLALFRAKQISESEASASKITPVLIIEEPESFLHPSAQAEFGRVLQDLAEEFDVQVVVTTHSPYLLSLSEPESNILLRRKTAYRQLRDTERVDTSGESWMMPFGQALGLATEEFKPWKKMMMNESDAILLVEGETDREYFEMLRDPVHGSNRLTFEGEVVSYDGTGALSNTVLLRFVKNRYERLFITFDLDAATSVEKILHSLEMEKGKQYLPVGLPSAGKRNIEGLLPERVVTAVYAANSGLVQAATAGTKDEQDSAKRKLKRLLLEEFKRVAQPGLDDFGHFYSVAKVANKALAAVV